MRAVLALLFLLLPDAAAAQPVQGPDVSIGYEEVGPWGTFRLFWRVDTSGAGVYEQSGPALDHFETGSIRMKPAEFTHLEDLLRPLDGAPQLPCPDAITDQGVRVLTWIRDDRTTTYILDRGCESEEARSVREQIDRAVVLVRASSTESLP